MNVVLDANIFISAYFWGGSPKIVIDRISRGLDILYITDDIIDEIENTLRKPKFLLNNDDVELEKTNLEKRGKKVIIYPKNRITGVCRDPKDDKYLECALAAKADYIISGDKDLLVLKEYRGVKIVTANGYLELANNYSRST